MDANLKDDLDACTKLRQAIDTNQNSNGSQYLALKHIETRICLESRIQRHFDKLQEEHTDVDSLFEEFYSSLGVNPEHLPLIVANVYFKGDA